MKNFLLGLATAYAITATLFMWAAPDMPALNWKGRVYYGAVWPAWPLSAATGRLVVPIPNWCFTFEELE